MNHAMLPFVAFAIVVALCIKAQAADTTPPSAETAATNLNAKPAPVRVIFDTDMDGDCDDAAALGILHALADNGEAEILAVTTSSLDPWAGPCIEAINIYYNRPKLPIGTARPPAPLQKSRFPETVAKRCPHTLQRSDQAPDAVELYLDILAKQPDKSVTIITVGEMTNLSKLMDAPAKDARPAGMELIRAKVTQWVCMGGNFIGSPARDDLKLGNNNFTLNAPATLDAVTRWPTPVVFVGREVASVPSGLKIGANLDKTPAHNPVRIAYEAYFGGKPKDRHVADPATVLFAVRGQRDYWNLHDTGHMALNPDMTFEWKEQPNRDQAYLLKKEIDGQPNDRHIEAALEELLLQPPRDKK